MGDTLITIVAIFISVMLMIIFPFMAIAEKSDDVSQLSTQVITAKFVDKIKTTGKLTLEDYDKFIQALSIGHSFEVDFKVQIIDENPGIIKTVNNPRELENNLYYSSYTTQIEKTLFTNEVLTFKEGDIITVTVKNTDFSISQSLRNLFFKIVSADSYTIAAQNAGMIMVNGADDY